MDASTKKVRGTFKGCLRPAEVICRNANSTVRKRGRAFPLDRQGLPAGDQGQRRNTDALAQRKRDWEVVTSPEDAVPRREIMGYRIDLQEEPGVILEATEGTESRKPDGEGVTTATGKVVQDQVPSRSLKRHRKCRGPLRGTPGSRGPPESLLTSSVGEDALSPKKVQMPAALALPASGMPGGSGPSTGVCPSAQAPSGGGKRKGDGTVTMFRCYVALGQDVCVTSEQPAPPQPAGLLPIIPKSVSGEMGRADPGPRDSSCGARKVPAESTSQASGSGGAAVSSMSPDARPLQTRCIGMRKRKVQAGALEKALPLKELVTPSEGGQAASSTGPKPRLHRGRDITHRKRMLQAGDLTESWAACLPGSPSVTDTAAPSPSSFLGLHQSPCIANRNEMVQARSLEKGLPAPQPGAASQGDLAVGSKYPDPRLHSFFCVVDLDRKFKAGALEKGLPSPQPGSSSERDRADSSSSPDSGLHQSLRNANRKTILETHVLEQGLSAPELATASEEGTAAPSAPLDPGLCHSILITNRNAVCQFPGLEKNLPAPQPDTRSEGGSAASSQSPDPGLGHSSRTRGRKRKSKAAGLQKSLLPPAPASIVEKGPAASAGSPGQGMHHSPIVTKRKRMLQPSVLKKGLPAPQPGSHSEGGTAAAPSTSPDTGLCLPPHITTRKRKRQAQGLEKGLLLPQPRGQLAKGAPSSLKSRDPGSRHALIFPKRKKKLQAGHVEKGTPVPPAEEAGPAREDQATNMSSAQAHCPVERGTVVWYKFRDHPFWPAVVTSISCKEKTARVLLIDANLTREGSGLKVPLHKLKHLDCKEKKDFLQRAHKAYGQSILWCFSLLTHYRDRVCHGAFVGSFLDYYAADSSYQHRRALYDIEQDMRFPKVDYADLEDSKDEPMPGGRRLLPDRMRAALDQANQRLVDFIVKTKGADQHLKDIMKGRKPSRWFSIFLKSSKYVLCYDTYLDDEEQLDAVAEHLQGLYAHADKTLLTLIRGDKVKFLMEVLLPEAIICSIAAVDGLDYKEAEEKYRRGSPVFYSEKAQFDKKILKEIKQRAAASSELHGAPAKPTQ